MYSTACVCWTNSVFIPSAGVFSSYKRNTCGNRMKKGKQIKGTYFILLYQKPTLSGTFSSKWTNVESIIAKLKLQSFFFNAFPYAAKFVHIKCIDVLCRCYIHMTYESIELNRKVIFAPNHISLAKRIKAWYSKM